MGRKYIDLTGKIFGALKVIEYVGNNKRGGSVWKCECKCGVVKNIDGVSLREHRTNSCGCLRYINSNILAENARVTLNNYNFQGTNITRLTAKKSKNNTSGHKGIWFNKKIGKWQSSIMLSGKSYHLGCYSNIDDAVSARMLAEQKLFLPTIKEFKLRQAGD